MRQVGSPNSEPFEPPPGGPDGYAVILATDPERSPEFLAQLRAVVARSRGGVLISLREPARWSGGPVISVHLRWDGEPRVVGPGQWLGPLTAADERRAVCRWLAGGGPLTGPPPADLRPGTLPGADRAVMAAQTLN